MQTGVAPGPLGVPNEFVKYARHRPVLPDGKRGELEYLLPDVLRALFNGCVAVGRVPEPWRVTAIRPIPKTAAPASFDDTRPIAVGSCLPKLFAATLNGRLSGWAERRGKHAPQQAGFRRHLSTTHHLFALRHMVDWHRHTGHPLYLAFVDFRKAYDSVDRHLLWVKLEHLGVRGRFLAALQSLYADDSAYVSLDGCRSARFGSESGVKQGCPLSPTLFSLFFDHIADYLQPPPGEGPWVPGLAQPLTSLLYADDVVIFANSVRTLNLLLQRLQSFCETWGMAVNTAKTKVMMVSGSAHARHTFYNGDHPVRFGPRLQSQPLERVRSYKYLGIEVEATGGFGGALAGAARRCRGPGAPRHVRPLRTIRPLGLV